MDLRLDLGGDMWTMLAGIGSVLIRSNPKPFVGWASRR
jgi:hypothetical protein